MNRLSLITLLAVGSTATPATAYVDGAQTVGPVIGAATHIVVLRVDKVNPEKRIILYQKVADLKGRHPTDQVKHQIRDGLHPHEPRTILAWARPGRIAVCFHDGKVAVTCIDRYWYECAASEAPWWSMTRGRPDLSFAYFGPAEKLRRLLPPVLAGEEVVIPALAHRGSGNAAAYEAIAFQGRLRVKDFPVWRVKASLKMPGLCSDLVGKWVVGPGAADRAEVPALARLLRHGSASERAEAAEDLGLVGPAAESAAPALREALADLAPPVRVRAAVALLRIGVDPQVGVPVLVELLKDGDAGIRKEAAEALGEIGPGAAKAVPALAAALKDDDQGVRWASAEALGLVGPAAAEAAPALTGLLADKALGPVAADALGGLGPSAKGAIAPLTKALQGADASLRWAAALALVRIDPEAAEPAARLFVKALREGDEKTRWDAHICLGKMGRAARGVVADLVEMFGSRNPTDSRWAANALCGLGPHAKAAVPALVGLVKGPSEEKRRAALGILRAIGPEAKEAIPALTGVLRDAAADGSSRVLAAAALWRIHPDGQAIVPVLATLAGGEDLSVRLHALGVLEQVGPAAKAAVPTLTGLLKHDDPKVRERAAAALKAIDPEAPRRAGSR